MDVIINLKVFKICKPLVVYRFYCKAFYHSKAWRHVIKESYNTLWIGLSAENLILWYAEKQACSATETSQNIEIMC